MAKIKVPFIPDSNIVTINVSGYFYKKIQTIFLAKGNERSREDFLRVLERAKSNEPIEDLYEAEIQVMAALVMSIEKAAQTQNKIEYKEVDEDGPTTIES